MSLPPSHPAAAAPGARPRTEATASVAPPPPARPPLGAASWAEIVSHVVHSLESAGIRFHCVIEHYPEPSEPVQWIGVREDGRKIWKFSLRYLMILDHIVGHTVLGLIDGRDGDAERVRAQIREVYRAAMAALHPEGETPAGGTRKWTQAFEGETPQDVIVNLVVFGPRELAEKLPAGVVEERVRGHAARFSVRWVVVDDAHELVPSVRWEAAPRDVRPTLPDLRRALLDWKFPERRKTVPPTRGDVGWVHLRRFEALFHEAAKRRHVLPIFVLMAAHLLIWLLLGKVLHGHEGETLQEWQKLLVCAFATTAVHTFFVAPFLWFTRDLLRLIGFRRYLELQGLAVAGYFAFERALEAFGGWVEPVYSSDGVVLGLGAALAAVTFRVRDRLPDLMARHWYFVGLYATLPLHGVAVGLILEGGKVLQRWSVPVSLAYFFLLGAGVVTGAVLLALYQVWQAKRGPAPPPPWVKRTAVAAACAVGVAVAGFLLWRFGYHGSEGWLYGPDGSPGRLYGMLREWKLDLPHLVGWFPGLLAAMSVGGLYGWSAARRAGDVLPTGWAGERWRGSSSVPGTSFVRTSEPPPAQPVEGVSVVARAESTPAAEWSENVAVGEYLLEQCLGRTALGPVWRAHARDNPADRVVIKRMDDPSGSDGDLLLQLPKYFRPDRDGRSGLMKAGIARVREVAPVGAGAGLAMVSDYVEGISLAHRLTHKVPLSERAVVRIHLAMARVLDAIHEEGILHRDMRPANILLTQTPLGALTRQDAIPEVGYAVLADFGLACRTGRPGASRLGAAGTGLGTPGYIPPEAWNGEWLDRRYDVYSLGMSLYFCLAGRRFNGEDRPFVEQFESMLGEGTPDWPDEAYFRKLMFGCERLGPELAAIVRRACSLDRSARHPTGLELARDLSDWLESRPLASVDYTPRQRVYFDVLRAHPLITAIGAAGLVFGAIASWGWMDTRWRWDLEREASKTDRAQRTEARKKEIDALNAKVESADRQRQEQVAASRAWLDGARGEVHAALQALEQDVARTLAGEHWLSRTGGRDPLLEGIGLLHGVAAQAQRLEGEYGRLCERLGPLLSEEDCKNARRQQESFSASVRVQCKEWAEWRTAMARVSDLLAARHRLASWIELAMPVRLREAREFAAALGEARREAERKPALATLAREVQEWAVRWLGTVQAAGGQTARSLSLGEAVIGGVRGQMVCLPYRWAGEAASREDDLVLRGPIAFWMSTEDQTAEGLQSFAEAQRRTQAFATVETLAQAHVQLAGLLQRFGVLTGKSYDRLEVRLPTAEEWELAARGMDGRLFPWGNERPGEREEQRILRGEDDGKDRSPLGFRFLAGRYAEWVLSDGEAREPRVAGAGYWDLRVQRAWQLRAFEHEAPGRMGYRIAIVPVASRR